MHIQLDKSWIFSAVSLIYDYLTSWKHNGCHQELMVLNWGSESMCPVITTGSLNTNSEHLNLKEYTGSDEMTHLARTEAKP